MPQTSSWVILRPANNPPYTRMLQICSEPNPRSRPARNHNPYQPRGYVLSPGYGFDHNSQLEVILLGPIQTRPCNHMDRHYYRRRSTDLSGRTDCGNHQFRDLTLPAVDLSTIEQACGGRIDGILGFDLLDKMDMTINLKRQVASVDMSQAKIQTSINKAAIHRRRNGALRSTVLYHWVLEPCS